MRTVIADTSRVSDSRGMVLRVLVRVAALIGAVSLSGCATGAASPEGAQSSNLLPDGGYPFSGAGGTGGTSGIGGTGGTGGAGGAGGEPGGCASGCRVARAAPTPA